MSRVKWKFLEMLGDTDSCSILLIQNQIVSWSHMLFYSDKTMRGQAMLGKSINGTYSDSTLACIASFASLHWFCVLILSDLHFTKRHNRECLVSRLVLVTPADSSQLG